jgi:type II secretory pathway pseudopilin PulG
MKQHLTASRAQQRGYVLLYTLIAASLFGILATGVLVSTLRELTLSEQSIENVKARWSAEAAVECVKYWNSTVYPSAFNTVGDVAPVIYCDTPTQSSNWGFSRPLSGLTVCEEYPVSILEMEGFFPGDRSCSRTEVTVRQNPHWSDICDVTMQTWGYNDCETRDVERTIWTTGDS